MKIILGIVGEHLNPALISARLGGQPRKSGTKGVPIMATDQTGQPVSKIAMAGFWQRAVSLRDSAAAEGAIADLFAGLTEDTSIWQKLSLEFRTEVSVHGVLPHVAPKDIFSEATLALLRNRGLQVVLRGI